MLDGLAMLVLMCTIRYTFYMSKLRSIGIREFRQDIAQYVDNAEPIALTRYGRTVGYFIPVHDPEQLRADLELFVKSAQKVQAIVDRLNVSEEVLLDDFRREREQS
ncbi:MAG: hypothetical protein R2880_01355 [Deinococcales bacterium]